MCFAADKKKSARFARSVKVFCAAKISPPLGLCIPCIYTWIMLAANATCDDYPHNAFLAQFFFISQTNKLDTSELHCKIAGSAAMSSIRGGQRARKRKLQRCPGDTNTGIKEQQGSKKRQTPLRTRRTDVASRTKHHNQSATKKLCGATY